MSLRSPSLRVKHKASRRKRTSKKKCKDEEAFEKDEKSLDFLTNEEVEYDQLNDIEGDVNERVKYLEFDKEKNMENPNLIVRIKFKNAKSLRKLWLSGMLGDGKM